MTVKYCDLCNKIVCYECGGCYSCDCNMSCYSHKEKYFTCYAKTQSLDC